MKLLLLLSLLSGQAYYEWVDQHGESHFTDDPGSIPANAKRRTVEGMEQPRRADPVRVDAGAPGRNDGGVQSAAPVRPAPPTVSPPTGPDSCERARKKVASLEAAVERGKAYTAEREKAQADRCMAQLQRFGQGAYAQCMATRQQGIDTRDTAGRDLEAAREELRRAQVDGCR